MIEFITGYKHEATYRNGFFDLAKLVFGIDFSPWHAWGFWTDDYVCYSYFDGGRAVANVSVNRMSLLICGKPRPAIQIGTVMTRPDYSGRGLATDLMGRVLADCDKDRDLAYLVANKDVTGFYPKFGFAPVPQHGYSHSLEETATSMGAGRFLDMPDKAGTGLILDLIARRSPVSSVFGVLGAEHILMFYAFHGFGECFFIDEAGTTIVVFRQEAGTIHLYDVIAPAMPALSDVLRMIPFRQATRVVFHFTPDLMGAVVDTTLSNCGDTLFVRPAGAFPSRDFLHPALAQA